MALSQSGPPHLRGQRYHTEHITMTFDLIGLFSSISLKQTKVCFECGCLSSLPTLLHLQVEVFVVEMQDPKSGVKGADQKLNVTIIPHVINGESRDSQHQMVAPLRDISPQKISPPISIILLQCFALDPFPGGVNMSTVAM